MTVLTLPDGRRLGYETQGAGAPVLTLHGAPGSRLTRFPYADRLAAAGVQQITYDRPGYGESDPLPGRTVADCVGDVAALLDHLDLDRVAVAGGSGGGPHALALATLLPERCTVVHSLVGLAPFDAPGFDPYAGMDEENVQRFAAGLRTREQAHEQLAPNLSALVERSRQDPATMLGTMKLPAADLAVLREVGAFVAVAVQEGARPGAWGYVDDFAAIARPWGFDPREAVAPVLIEYGAHDVSVPASHGAWLADNVPHVGVTVTTGGHFSTTDESLARLVSLALRSA